MLHSIYYFYPQKFFTQTYPTSYFSAYSYLCQSAYNRPCNCHSPPSFENITFLPVPCLILLVPFQVSHNPLPLLDSQFYLFPTVIFRLIYGLNTAYLAVQTSNISVHLSIFFPTYFLLQNNILFYLTS